MTARSFHPATRLGRTLVLGGTVVLAATGCAAKHHWLCDGGKPILSDGPRNSSVVRWSRQVAESVTRAWRPPKDVVTPGWVELSVEFQRDGRVSAIDVLGASGDAAIIETARAAILSVTMPPLPVQYKDDVLRAPLVFYHRQKPKAPCSFPSEGDADKAEHSSSNKR